MPAGFSVRHTAAINSLELSITVKACDFIGGYRELSGSEKENVQYWKQWLHKYASQEPPVYPAKRHAWKHIHDAATVDYGLALLVMLASKATHLMVPCPEECCIRTFQGWLFAIEMVIPQQADVLRTIFQDNGFDKLLGL